MTFYRCLGSTEAFSYTVSEAWHEFDSFFESRNGTSPLAQLCREVNRLEEALLKTPHSWFRIGAEPVDTSLSEVDYDSHPEWNPLSDAGYFLAACVNQIQLCFIEFFEASTLECSTDGVYRVFPDFEVFQDFLDSVSGLSPYEKTHQKQYLDAIRQLLEDIQAITSVDVLPYKYKGTIQYVSYPIRIELDEERSFNDPAALFPFGSGNTQIRFGNGSSWANYNLWHDRQLSPFGSESTFINESPTGWPQLGARFGIPYNGSTPSFSTSSDGAYYYFNLPNSFSFPHGAGWRTYKKAKITVRFEKNILGTFSEEEKETLFEELTGREVFWTASDGSAGSVGNPTFTTSPGISGSFIWGSGETYKDIEFTFNLTDAIPNGVNTSLKTVSASVVNDYYTIGQGCDNELHVCFDEV